MEIGTTTRPSLAPMTTLGNTSKSVCEPLEATKSEKVGMSETPAPPDGGSIDDAVERNVERWENERLCGVDGQTQVELCDS